MRTLRRAANRFVVPESRKGWVASQVGLPAMGSRLVNRHGIEWVVREHAPLPTVETFGRWNSGGIALATDLYPVVEPLNLSPKLLEFLHAINRCTTKSFAIVDTMPGRRKDGHVPGGNHIDTVCHPETNVLFLDAARVSETIIAHELGHAWLQYVERCEDLRTSGYDDEPGRARMVSYVQSYVLDLRVNALLREKGFDVSPIEEDQAASLEQLASALGAGYEPETAREEVFMALLVADAKVRFAAEGAALVREDRALPAIRSARPALDRLAGNFAEAVMRHGHGSAESVERAVDECLLAAFGFAGEPFDPEVDLVRVDAPEPEGDKFPEWLPALSPQHKCEVGRHMALNDVSSEWPHRLEATLGGRARVVFTAPDGSRTSQVVVNQSYGPPTTRYLGMSEEVAEVSEFKRQNQERRERAFTPPNPHRAPTPFDLKPIQPGFGIGPMRRNYMAGTGRFLTAVRQDMWLAGEHPYGYALNNPVTYTDPSGNDPRDFYKCMSSFTRGGFSLRSSCEWCRSLAGYPYNCGDLPTKGKRAPAGDGPPGTCATLPPGWTPPLGTIIPGAGLGLGDDPYMDPNVCNNACILAAKTAFEMEFPGVRPNMKAIRKACTAACNAYGSKECEGLLERCQKMGDHKEKTACVAFWEFACVPGKA